MLYQSIKNRKIKFAIVGCGRIAANHVKAIEQHADNVELSAICDDNLPVLEEKAHAWKANPFGSYDRLLHESDCDIVVLCTPSGLHAQQAIQAAQRGKHVMTEKPMATRWKDGIDMVKACDTAQRRLFVVKQNRRNVTLQLLKRAVNEKRFGKIYMVHMNVFWSRPQAYYDSAAWRGTWEMDGGAFMNQASHYVDLLEWLIGPVESVQAYTATLARNIEVEDTGTVSVKWRSG
ncbi:MAG: Gfo/Idh/MocA family oxidoreductase, partial [Desulfovibrionaceae bacterium]